jgi:hypothetical protein
MLPARRRSQPQLQIRWYVPATLCVAGLTLLDAAAPWLQVNGGGMMGAGMGLPTLDVKALEEGGEEAAAAAAAAAAAMAAGALPKAMPAAVGVSEGQEQDEDQ